RYRSRRSIPHDLRDGKPSARHDFTTSSRPSSYVGKEGRHPKSRRNRAFEVENEEVNSRVPYRPRNIRASHRDIRRGGRSPSRLAISPRNSTRVTGRIIDDMPHAGLRRFGGRDEGARGVVRVNQGPQRTLATDEHRASLGDRVGQNSRMPAIGGAESAAPQRERGG